MEQLLTKEERMVMMECGNVIEMINYLDDLRDLKRLT